MKTTILLVITMLLSSGCTQLEAKLCSTNSVNNSIETGIDNYQLEKVINKNDSLDENLVCKLVGTELLKRKEELKKNIFKRLIKVEEIEKGYIFHFPYKEEFVIKMMDWILAENNCCPFLEFGIKIESNKNIKLVISGQEGTKEMIKIAILDQIN